MFKIITPIMILLLTVSGAQARSLLLSGRAGNYEAEIAIDRNPPIIGDNGIEIKIRDSTGRAVTTAQVLVNYYMPPMPRMAPMNYTIPARLLGDTYRAVMRLIMDGPWIIALKITEGGKTSSVKFHINAR
jgi:hypothetical protein